MSYLPYLKKKERLITNAEIKALRSTPIEIIAAPGAGKFISVVTMSVKFNYGGNNVFVSGGNLNLYATNTSGPTYLTINPGIYTGSVDNVIAIGSVTAIGAATLGLMENQAVVLSTGTSDPTGNAAGDNTMYVSIIYQELSLP